ncbi:MAG: hypothetical protein JOZ19_06540 [Rubrobacter sp.]|nr:hypothetical protein [Rubrobacter sp.]
MSTRAYALRPHEHVFTLEILCANVAAAIGLSPLEGERIRPEVEGAPLPAP